MILEAYEKSKIQIDYENKLGAATLSKICSSGFPHRYFPRLCFRHHGGNEAGSAAMADYQVHSIECQWHLMTYQSRRTRLDFPAKSLFTSAQEQKILTDGPLAVNLDDVVILHNACPLRCGLLLWRLFLRRRCCLINAISLRVLLAVEVGILPKS